ncbi:hypothetical protein IEQ34_000791 [Dendrobium chrysotoxum]|uniref:Uncharacterized protein n=1 Tax=Dendrobium chrysotoxum TaxID=161865 RepID=A0AAV7HUJ3_DENCH|nr:hypothetical protein IEQ34_000791 [Dendrobium chrysotoxum]
MWSEFVPTFLQSHVNHNGIDRIFQRSWNSVVSRNLHEKWGKLKDLSTSLHVTAEDLLKMLNLLDVDTLHYAVRYLSRYIDEEYLFKLGISTQAWRSHTHMRKKLTKDPKAVSSPKRLLLND